MPPPSSLPLCAINDSLRALDALDHVTIDHRSAFQRDVIARGHAEDRRVETEVREVSEEIISREERHAKRFQESKIGGSFSQQSITRRLAIDLRPIDDLIDHGRSMYRRSKV